ncbi:hypothetical protein [Solibacillus sp. CAU 1738]|uniref:hypothetical protein n=1 Tax=Solibacillus sp. CAU 1738 TaxID=3140363 RepID=UPI003260ED73
MKKSLILLSALCLFGCSDRESDDVAKQVNYHFSAEPKACAYVFYEVEGAPALELEDRNLNFRFDDQNIITTSSPLDFGWESKESAGIKTYNYYNSEGTKIAEEEIPTSVTGAVTVDDVEHDFTEIHFNDKEECFSDDSAENNKIFSELIEKIYKKINK